MLTCHGLFRLTYMSLDVKESKTQDVVSTSSQVFTPFSLDLDWVSLSTGMSEPDQIVLLEGDMGGSPVVSSSSSSSKIPQMNMDTLDEPISETLMRDLRSIFSKVNHVILPTSKSGAYKTVLRDWDLWVGYRCV